MDTLPSLQPGQYCIVNVKQISASSYRITFFLPSTQDAGHGWGSLWTALEATHSLSRWRGMNGARVDDLSARWVGEELAFQIRLSYMHDICASRSMTLQRMPSSASCCYWIPRTQQRSGCTCAWPAGTAMLVQYHDDYEGDMWRQTWAERWRCANVGHQALHQLAWRLCHSWHGHLRRYAGTCWPHFCYCSHISRLQLPHAAA